MNAFWSWFVIGVTVLNLVGLVWLLMATARRRQPGEAETTGHVWDGDVTELNNPLPLWWLGLFVLTVIFVVGSAVLGQNTLGLLIALLLRGRNRVARSVVTSLVIAAWAVPETVAGFCWFAFLYRTGTLNTLLTHFGVQQNWLYTAPMVAVIVANVWRGTAFSMLVYDAALSDVPPELLEAAAVDGASAWQRLRRVTLPLIRRSIVSNLMLITLQTLAAFGLIFVMTGGGPGTKSQTTPLYMYEQSFKFYQLGYGTAMALVLLVIGALFSAIYLRLIKLEES